jgi:ribosome maturation factor RimP
MSANAPAAGAGQRKTATGKAAEIEALIEPTLEAMGYTIVRVLLSGNPRHQRLQVMVERSDGAAMDVDACAEASRAVEAVLDVEDPLESAYELEVSSPGMDRPLTRAADFERFAGHTARVELVEPFEGRRRLTGELLGLVDGEIAMAVDNMEWRIGFDEIAKAKLVVTDALLKQAQKAAKQQPDDRGAGTADDAH